MTDFAEERMLILGGAVALDGVKDVVKGAILSAGRASIERWSRDRAQTFFDAFCQRVADHDATEAEIGVDLNTLMASDSAQKVLFDAYRSVCLSRSRLLGPRIVALITARLVLEGREADDEEDGLLAAAEELTDDELRSLQAEIETLNRVADEKARPGEEGRKARRRGEDLVEEIRSEDVPADTASSWGSDTSLAPINLALEVGRWAAKLERQGLVYTDMLEKPVTVKEDSERHIDYDHHFRSVRWFVGYTGAASRLAALVANADTMAVGT